MALPATESFSGAAAPLPNPPWTNTEAQDIALNGLGGGDVSGTGDNIAIWNADVFPDDQQVSLTAQSTLSGHGDEYIGVIARSDGLPESSCSCYQFFSDGGSDTELAKVVAGAFTVLGTANATTVTTGDVLELVVVGTALTASVNGTPVITATDAAVASGQPGLVLNSSNGPNFLAVGPWVANASGGGGGGGSPHTVTGRGSVAIAGLAWLSTALSGTFPPFTTTGNAEPTNYYHVGMLSWGTVASGAIQAYPVTRLLDLVEIPTGMDTLWYEFAPGITAVISELATP